MMKRNGMMCGLMTSVLSVSMLTGCFGESVVSAGAKVAGGQITTLTVNEIKILNQTILDVLMSQNPGFEGKPLTDVQAHALLAFFIANDFNTLEDLEKLHGIDPSTLKGLDALEAAFAEQGQDYEVLEFDHTSILSTIVPLGGTGSIGPGLN